MGFIKFLGTAGARFVMISQLRASGGIWLNYKTTNVIIDPGPGALVRCFSSRPKLDPSGLDAIVLTHKHLDHSGDLAVMVEALTNGGFNKRGVLFVPGDALGKDGVVFSYLKNHMEKIEILKKGNFSVGDINFNVPVRNIHSVETYGLKFFLGKEIVSFSADTKYFDDLVKVYADSTMLVLNVVFYQKKAEYDHLCLPEAIDIVKAVRPKKAIFTHFGMTMLKQKPHILEKKVREDLKLDVKFAYDGMTIEEPF